MTKAQLPTYAHAPCKECPNRYIGCHGKCEKYIQFQKDNEKSKEKERLSRIGAGSTRLAKAHLRKLKRSA